jgi:hypothetical protein
LEAEVNLVAENVDVKEFPNVFFALVCVESLLSGESLPDFGQFFRDSFGL